MFKWYIGKIQDIVFLPEQADNNYELTERICLIAFP